MVRNRLTCDAVAIVTSDEIDQSQQAIMRSVFCSIIILWISICAPCLSTSLNLETPLLCYHTNLQIQSICGLLVFDSPWSSFHRSMCSLTTAAAPWKKIKKCRLRKCKQHQQRIDVDTVPLFFLHGCWLKGLNWWSCYNEVIMRYSHFFIQWCSVSICV